MSDYGVLFRASMRTLVELRAAVGVETEHCLTENQPWIEDNRLDLGG